MPTPSMITNRAGGVINTGLRVPLFPNPKKLFELPVPVFCLARGFHQLSLAGWLTKTHTSGKFYRENTALGFGASKTLARNGDKNPQFLH